MSNNKKLDNVDLKKYLPIITITSMYVLFATLWILFSDRILARIIPDSEQYIYAQTYKGWFFVVVTGLLLYNTILHQFKQHWKTAREVEQIAAFSKDIRGILDPHTLTLKILTLLHDLFQAESVFFGQPDGLTKMLKLSFRRGPEELLVQYIPDSDPIWQPVLHQAQSISSYRNFGHSAQLTFAGQSLKQYAVSPLIAREVAIGLIGFARENPVERSDLHLLQAVADITSQAFFVADLLHNNVTQIRRLSSMRKIDDSILTNFDIQNLIKLLLKEFIDNLGVDAAAITVLNHERRTIDIYQQIGLNETEPAYLNEAFNYVAGCDTMLVIQNTKTGIHSERNYPRHHPIHNASFISYAVSPLISQEEKLGIVELYARREIDWNRETTQFFEALARQTAVAIDRVNLVLNLQKSNLDLTRSYEETLEGWSRALDMRDHETENHTQRVTALTIAMGQRLGLSEEQLTHMRRGSLLHDIGKLVVPDTILLKEGDLTPEEWQIMRQHPLTARNLLEPITFLAPALTIPYFHHEKWDGSGYPQGLSGGSIPIEARIFAIVDVWDALTNDRPYRTALSPVTAARHILAQSGKHFDPQIVNSFLEMLNENGVLSDADMLNLMD